MTTIVISFSAISQVMIRGKGAGACAPSCGSLGEGAQKKHKRYQKLNHQSACAFEICLSKCHLASYEGGGDLGQEHNPLQIRKAPADVPDVRPDFGPPG
jgi:hypothetical protein